MPIDLVPGDIFQTAYDASIPVDSAVTSQVGTGRPRTVQERTGQKPHGVY